MTKAIQSKGKITGKRGRVENLKMWPKGVSGNPGGRAKGSGNSWAATIRAIGELTPAEAARRCHAIAGQLQGLGDKITLREAVVMRVYSQLLFEPQGSLFDKVMERAEGKVALPVDVSMTWREELRRLGYDPEQIQSEAVEQFAAIVAAHSVGHSRSPDGGGMAGGEA